MNSYLSSKTALKLKRLVSWAFISLFSLSKDVHIEKHHFTSRADKHHDRITHFQTILKNEDFTSTVKQFDPTTKIGISNQCLHSAYASKLSITSSLHYSYTRLSLLPTTKHMLTKIIFILAILIILQIRKLSLRRSPTLYFASQSRLKQTCLTIKICTILRSPTLSGMTNSIGCYPQFEQILLNSDASWCYSLKHNA